MASHHQGDQHAVQVLQLSASSQAQLEKHQAVLIDLEAKKVAASIDVPTLPAQVQAALRELGLPVRLFGENLANVRDRLRMELARRQVFLGQEAVAGVKQEGEDQKIKAKEEEEEEEVTKYTRASPGLVEARQAIAKFSLERAAARLRNERRYKQAAVKRKRMSVEEKERDVDIRELEALDERAVQTYQTVRQMALEGSQYGDSRALSCIAACSQNNTTRLPLVATGSWTGSLQLWDGSSPVLQKVGERTMCHQDRIMGIAMMQTLDHKNDDALICTTSIDLTAKLWKVQQSDVVAMDDTDDNQESSSSSKAWTIIEQGHLQGHQARLCRTAFHPMKRHVATTSFDHSWRLWDIETNQQLLLQDGHWKEVYGIGFHPDGSLCATTDYAGVVQLWDLRTGKSIRHFLGHAQRVLNAEFHPAVGFQLATAGDDGTIKIWDLRKRKQAASIPAHSGLVTNLCFDSSGGGGEFMASSSFDGSVKLWNTRNWKMLNSLQGHEGKVAGIDIVSSSDNNSNKRGALSVVSCGFDKTLKMWR